MEGTNLRTALCAKAANFTPDMGRAQGVVSVVATCWNSVRYAEHPPHRKETVQISVCKSGNHVAEGWLGPKMLLGKKCRLGAGW